MTLPTTRLAEIEERHGNATPAPWDMMICDDGIAMVATAGDVICVPEPNHPIDDPMDRKNFAFIAACRSDIPYLLAALTAAQERERMDAELMREAANVAQNGCSYHDIPCADRPDCIVTKLRTRADQLGGRTDG